MVRSRSVSGSGSVGGLEGHVALLQRAHDPFRDRRLDARPTLGQRPDGAGEALERDVLEQPSLRAGAHGVEEHRVVVERGEDQRRPHGVALAQASQHADAVEARHAQIEQDDVGFSRSMTSTASSPSLASAATSMSGTSREGCAGPGGRWSGPRRCRRGSRARAPSGQRHVDVEAAAAHRRHFERAARLLHALAEAEQAVAEADVVGADAVVARVDRRARDRPMRG